MVINNVIFLPVKAHCHRRADSKNDHPTKVSSKRQNFKELNKDGFDFINEKKCTDVHKF